MELQLSKLQFVTILTFFAFPSLLHASNERKPYIVYMGGVREGMRYVDSVDQHHSLLSSIIGDEEIAQKSRIHSCGRSLNAFAAHLLPHEADKLKEDENVISVFPSKKLELHTTRSWDFLRMPLTVQRNIPVESDLIVGLLDSGIYIDAPSFSDLGLGPPPAKWKGTCQIAANFTRCNNKVIGARAYDLGNPDIFAPTPSPVDVEGHGTHTSSTAAGATAGSASLYGLGIGTARGGVPSARIAMYKVCGSQGCTDINMLAAFDDAIADGVDILSVSLGTYSSNYFTDPIAIGSFHAMTKGILTSCSSGNGGPFLQSISNFAPWVVTVAASGMDRQFRTVAKLGNGKEISGISVNTYQMEHMYPLTSGTLAANLSNNVEYGSPAWCSRGTLDPEKVKGKIILCTLLPATDYVKDLGAVGLIATADHNIDTGFTFDLPTTLANKFDMREIEMYINTTKNPQAIIYKSITQKVRAPFVASFSSRGPNPKSPTVLKPDIVAPGIDILAAYSKFASTTGEVDDNRFNVYNIVSGTSISCPQVAGAAAYVKTFHPDWSPAAIKSALMTTATKVLDVDGHKEWGYGSGQINPVEALNPGLVYDLSPKDYALFLCAEEFTGTAISIIVGRRVNCTAIPPYGGNDMLNYPTMNLELARRNSTIAGIFHRKVTNVGSHQPVVYTATVTAPNGVNVSVYPEKLRFERFNQRKRFTVVVLGPEVNNATSFGVLSLALEWSDGQHRVRSPIVVAPPV